MDTSYIFGNTGNLSDVLGSGWSVEDTYAWAVGSESTLSLKLPDDDVPLALRLDLHPAVFPPRIPRQRLIIRSLGTVLGSYELAVRETLTIDLPMALTRGAARLDLTLVHPDAARPRDHAPVDDTRRLALCFHTAGIARRAADDAETAWLFPALEPMHGLIAGGATALRMCEVISLLPALRGRYGVRHLDLSLPLEQTLQRLPPGTLDTLGSCWLELNAGPVEIRDALRARLPADCRVRAFYSPIVRSLFPFHAPDPRAVFEAGRYKPSRYPYSDRLAQALAGPHLLDDDLPDDALYAMYEASAAQETLDLDELYTYDLRRWRAEGRKSDMRLAEVIERHFRTSRVFIAPDRVGPVLLRAMIDQVLDDGAVRDVAAPEVLGRELDRLLDGYVGWQEEVPVDQRVAEHFGLTWWSPDLRYRWRNNLRSHRDHVLGLIRWTPWCP